MAALGHRPDSIGPARRGGRLSLPVLVGRTASFPAERLLDSIGGERRIAVRPTLETPGQVTVVSHSLACHVGYLSDASDSAAIIVVVVEKNNAGLQ